MLTADAGSGKSSVVGDLVLRCPPGQAPGADREALPDALQRRHVVRINLKGLNGVEIPPEPDTAGPIWQLLRQELTAASHPDASVSLDDPAAIGACDLLRQQLGAGGLLLLDALDEVIDAEQRARARRLIVRLAAELPPACALLVTARPYAFDDGSLPGFLGPWSLRPLSIRGEDPQVRQLIRRWLTALAEAPGGEQAAGEALYRDLASDPMRAEMAEIPLLLTLFIGVAHSRGEDGHRDPLPRDRAALLEETMALVLERWLYRIRDAVGDAIPPELTPDKLRRALQLMSLRALREQPAHQRRRASTGILVTANVFDKAVQDALGRDLIAKLYDARDTLRYRAGVLRRLGVGEEEPYEFIHRQFQEYLAGLELVQRHVAGDGADDLAAVLAAELEADPGVWREVARFALVILARHKGAPQALDVAARLLAAPHATEAVSPARWEALGVAAVALADVQDAMASASARSGEAARGARSGLDAWYLRLCDDAQAPPAARRDLGSTAGRIGEPDPAQHAERRRGVIPTAWTPDPAKPFALDPQRDFDWVCIDAGSFVPGSTPEDVERKDDDPRKADANELNASREPVQLGAFEIARYPVTNAQYAAFVRDPEGFGSPAARGAEPPACWWFARAWQQAQGRAPGGEDAAVRWWRQEGADKYRFWLETRPGDHLRLPNHPVVTVTWYEAMAFCRWLTLRADNQGPGGRHRFEYSLPSEIQWERAARGAAGLRWPWGNDWRPGAANTEEAGLGATTAVGLFPQRPADGQQREDVRDLAGNVWEWTRTRWGSDFAEPEFNWPLGLNDERDDPPGTVLRIFKGGSWSYTPRDCRGACRDRDRPDGYWNATLGFRVLRVSLA